MGNRKLKLFFEKIVDNVFSTPGFWDVKLNNGIEKYQHVVETCKPIRHWNLGDVLSQKFYYVHPPILTNPELWQKKFFFANSLFPPFSGPSWYNVQVCELFFS
jgi:hypothetical protein